MSDQVVLVDQEGRPVGTADKMAAHRQALLHRAFSVFVFDSQGRMLIQRRNRSKYHSGGLWSNTCCSHPRPGEGVAEAAHRRLQEEMGFDCDLREVLQFTYRAEFDNGLTEHEYDHVLLGTFDGSPAPDPAEVEDWEWVAPAELLARMEEHPGQYTPWFRLIAERVIDALEEMDGP